MFERTVTVGSGGKTFSFTGWKVGYLTGSPALLQPVAKAHQFLTFTTPPMLQWAVAEALDDPAIAPGCHAQWSVTRERLIAAILTADQMRQFRELANRLQMAALVEVHDHLELDAAIASGADIIGVNNRNLHTFEVALETSIDLAARIPAGAVKVAESGIHSQSDVARLRAVGFDAFLVGEHLMKSPDPAAARPRSRSSTSVSPGA